VVPDDFRYEYDGVGMMDLLGDGVMGKLAVYRGFIAAKSRNLTRARGRRTRRRMNRLNEVAVPSYQKRTDWYADWRCQI
jgi:hypothetical protein